MNMYAWGTGQMCELGLGPEANSKTVKRPRANRFMQADTNQIVDFAVGGMHGAAITADGRLMTWGVNDQGALGRNTAWSGGQDVDIDDGSDVDEEQQPLNPLESTPMFVEEGLPADDKIVRVACADSLTVVVTERAQVYAWGTFRAADGILGFSADAPVVTRPVKMTGLHDIVAVATGSDHVLVLTTAGRVFSWGNGQQHQLGRKVVERTRMNGLVPREFGLKNIRIIGAGSYHSFAIDANANVWAWGLNQYGQCGISALGGEDGAVVPVATKVPALCGLNIVQITGGEHHSCALTANGDLYVWGRLDLCELGVSADQLPPTAVADATGRPRFVPEPFKLTNLPPLSYIAAGSHHNIGISKIDGSMWSWGFSESYQTGQGPGGNDVEVPTRIENTATRDVRMLKVGAGGQFSVSGGLPLSPQTNGD